jgi:arginyl-tRNA synthetase
MRAVLQLQHSLRTILAAMDLPWPDKAAIEPPRDPAHGDLAANLAFALSRQANLSPRELAEKLAQSLRGHDASLEKVEAAGAGFLNVTFSPAFWQAVVPAVEEAGDRFGAGHAGAGRRIQVEYVSANPTGPLHIGHGRGAAVGDSLARILRFAGWDVSTEYYINDAGRQMRLLGVSVWLRLKEAAGLPVDWPDDFYRGAYIRDIALELLAVDPSLARLPDEQGEARCFAYGMNTILQGIKDDLAAFRVEHQHWFSERSLVDQGLVEATFARLRAAGLTFEQDGALWFQATRYGDDRDRVLRKSDGSLTYFASDIAYHDDKYRRGFDRVVDVWGADHHGYVPRMRAAAAALGRRPEDFDVVLIQLVALLQQGETIAMSTRAGTFETLADVVREVGADAARFMFLSRNSDSPLDFDLDLVRRRSMDNPVYYVQYAHARARSMLRRAADEGLILPPRTPQAVLAALGQPEELALLRAMDRFADVAAFAAADLAPHSVSRYLMELAGQMHSYYAKHPVLQAGDADVTMARLALMRALGQTIRNGLNLLGVSAPDSM